MALGQTSTKNSMAVYFTTLGGYIGAYSGATEATGGSPAYARKQTTWPGTATNGVVVGSEVELDLPAGTWDGIGIFSAASGGNLIEKIGIASLTYSSQGKLRITPSYTQS